MLLSVRAELKSCVLPLAMRSRVVLLSDGAALVYTSAKDGVNCGVLHRYLLSCLYPEAFPCREGGQVCLYPCHWNNVIDTQHVHHLLSVYI